MFTPLFCFWLSGLVELNLETILYSSYALMLMLQRVLRVLVSLTQSISLRLLYHTSFSEHICCSSQPFCPWCFQHMFVSLKPGQLLSNVLFQCCTCIPGGNTFLAVTADCTFVQTLQYGWVAIVVCSSWLLCKRSFLHLFIVSLSHSNRFILFFPNTILLWIIWIFHAMHSYLEQLVGHVLCIGQQT